MKNISYPLTVALFLCLTPAFADDDGDDQGKKLQAEPFVFVGSAADCGTTAGSGIVTSAWLTGMGLPDNGSSNTAPGNRDAHFGLLLSKNGKTADCSSAGAIIKGAEGMKVTELGFDYRNGGHCGAGAPRFNLLTSDNIFHFMGGCANGTKSPAPQDPAEWTRVRIDPANPAQAFPPVAPGAKIKSLSIIFDEGTDTTSTDDPKAVGLAVLDNIDVNSTLIRKGPGDNNDKKDGDDKKDDGNDQDDK